MTKRVLLFSVFSTFSLVLLILSAGSAAGQEEDRVLWGSWSGGLGDTIEVHPASVLCVWSPEPVRLVSPDEQGFGYLFTPADEPHCRMVMGASSLEVEEATGEVRVLASRTPPRVLERPGVTPLGEEGHAVLARGMSPEGEVTLAPGGADFVAEAISWPTLRPLVVDPQGAQWRVQAAPGEDVLVVVGASGHQPALLRWTDPGWYPVTPNLGQVLAPVALALLVSLFRGGAGGEWIQPGASRKRDGSPSGKGKVDGKQEDPTLS